MNVQKSASEASQPVLCHSCQTFYGTQTTEWLCSSCYKKGKKSEKIESTPELVPEQVKEVPPAKEEAPEEEKKEVAQVDRKRCFACKKKVGLLGVECKCKYVFCNGHRMPQDHSCEFDFKSRGIKELEKTVVKVDHAKIAQI